MLIQAWVLMSRGGKGKLPWGRINRDISASLSRQWGKPFIPLISTSLQLGTYITHKIHKINLLILVVRSLFWGPITIQFTFMKMEIPIQ